MLFTILFERSRGISKLTFMPRIRRNSAVLKAISKHLIYEFGMLHQTCELARHEDVRAKKNAFLESWAMHARNLFDFFYSTHEPTKKPRIDDVIAEDFFLDSSFWPSVRPNPSEDLTKLGKRVAKEIAHLTYARASAGPIGPKWPNSRLTNEFRTIVLKFRAVVPSEHVDSRFISYFS